MIKGVSLFQSIKLIKISPKTSALSKNLEEFFVKVVGEGFSAKEAKLNLGVF